MEYHIIFFARFGFRNRGASAGQSLIEVVIALTIGAILMGSAVFAVAFMLRSTSSNEYLQTVAILNQDLLDRVQSISDGNWLDLYNLSKGSSTTYYAVASGTVLSPVRGVEGVIDAERPSGLVSHLKMDEWSGNTFFDSTAQQNIGTLSGGTRVGGCWLSRCVRFDGGSAYATITDDAALDATSSISVAAWVYASSTSGGVVAAKHDDSSYAWELSFTNDGLLRATVNADGNIAQTTSTVPANVWTHAAFSYDGSQIVVYVNGAVKDTTSYAASITTNNVAVSIGRRLTTASPGYFDGLIDDVRVYDRALSGEDIYAIYGAKVFTRYFYVENVGRDSGDNITTGAGTDDPSTQKVTVVTAWRRGSATSTVSVSNYLTRWKNAVFRQTDWSGGGSDSSATAVPTNTYQNATSVGTSAGTITVEGF